MDLLPVPRRVDFRSTRAAEPSPEPAATVARLGARGLPREGYRISIAPSGEVDVEAADGAGAFYAQQTLAQLARLSRAHGGRLPVGTVEDWPDVPVRGVMLDVSRDKVPTMDTVRALVDRLAGWKVNQLQLYMEHTFAYRDHEDVWRAASPFTAEEVVELDAYCRARHVELVPNQNCLGHWERWLRHERYRPLAIRPDGWDHHGRHRRPTTIDPDNAGCLPLVQSLLAELLPNFTSRRVHVGLDEPWELPNERIDDYMTWLHRLRALPELDGREMLVWGDILETKPEHLAALPADVTVCEWGYEDWHPFAARAEAYASADRPFWVCPGTSSWMTILGRWTNMIGNCAAAADAAVSHGAAGMLVTDWGDNGHIQYLPVSEPGHAYGAAVAWCVAANRDIDLPAALSEHAYGDGTGELGAALHELGDVHRLVGPQVPNISVLAMHLYFPQVQLGRTFSAGLTIDDLYEVEAALSDATARLARARPERAGGALVVEELQAGAALVALLCRDAIGRLDAGRDGTITAIPEAERRSLASQVGALIERHRALWLARNRPGGLDDSVRWLEHLRDCYERGTAEVDWGGW